MRPRTKNVLKRLLLAASLSWIFSGTLGLLLFIRLTAKDPGSWLSHLVSPGFIPITLAGSTVIAIGMTPVAVWSVRAGAKNLRIYGPVLWIVLATYTCVLVVIGDRAGIYGFCGLLALGFVGAAILGFIPPLK